MKIAIHDVLLMLKINRMFLGYIDRKHKGILYSKNQTLPKELIKLYYELDVDDRHLDELKEQFVNHYIDCECILEDTHSNFERDGLKEMYDYIHSDEINNNFDIYTLLELHRKLYSKAPYPDAGGFIRNAPAHLNDVAIDLSPYYMIRQELKELDVEVKELLELGKIVSKNPTRIFEYIERCVMLKCQLIKIHPFFDGNGRSIRGFINKLFLNAGLPSIYIYADESMQYKKAMGQALGDGDYTHIIDFCYYKICDSIFELDIRPKIYGENSISKQILDLASECKREISKQNIDRSDWNSSYIYALEKYLTQKGIQCEIYSTSSFNKNSISHNFLLVYYKEKRINKRLLLDPMFENLYNDDYIYLAGDSNSKKAIFNNLIENGVTSISHADVACYVNFFKSYEEISTNETDIVISRPKQLGMYKKPRK